MARYIKNWECIDTLPCLNITKFVRTGFIGVNKESETEIYFRDQTMSFDISIGETEGVLIVGNNQSIDIISVVPNLGIGLMWFFVCPITGNNCRKLYFYDGNFKSRSAIPLNYEQQNYSHNARAMAIIFKKELSDPAEGIIKKNTKLYYKGKPSKPHLRVLRRIEKNEMTDVDYKNFIKLLKI